jgi:hypothetical protein
MTTQSSTATALAYLKAREAFEQAEKAKKQAEAELKLAFATEGIDFTVVDGQMVKVVEGERTNYDAETLRDLISAPLYKKVTKATVDGKKFQSAIDMGSIKPEVVDAITSVTPYTQVRVTDVAKDKASTDTATVKVA